MTFDDYEVAMRHRLLEAGFNFDQPDPALAWEVFKAFAEEPVECDDSYLFWEAADGYFDFVREFAEDRDTAIWCEQMTIHFTSPPPDHQGIQPVAVFSRDHANYEEFYKAVESRVEFRTGLEFGHWLAEVRLDGC